MMKKVSEALIAWAAEREPNEIIGGRDNPYMYRWWWFKSRMFSVYVHRFMRSDDDRAEHDHPAPYATYIATSGYFEHRKGVRRWIAEGRWAVRLNPWSCHRVELMELDGVKRQAWTIFFRGPNIRFSRWGFHCKSGWVHWRNFNSAGGCGDGKRK